MIISPSAGQRTSLAGASDAACLTRLQPWCPRGPPRLSQGQLEASMLSSADCREGELRAGLWILCRLPNQTEGGGSAALRSCPSAVCIIPHQGTRARRLTCKPGGKSPHGLLQRLGSFCKGSAETLAPRPAEALGLRTRAGTQEVKRRACRLESPKLKGTSHRPHGVLCSGRGSLPPAHSHGWGSLKGLLKRSPVQRARPAPALPCLPTSCPGSFVSCVTVLPAPRAEPP